MVSTSQSTSDHRAFDEFRAENLCSPANFRVRRTKNRGNDQGTIHGAGLPCPALPCPALPVWRTISPERIHCLGNQVLIPTQEVVGSMDVYVRFTLIQSESADLDRGNRLTIPPSSAFSSTGVHWRRVQKTFFAH